MGLMRRDNGQSDGAQVADGDVQDSNKCCISAFWRCIQSNYCRYKVAAPGAMGLCGQRPANRDQQDPGARDDVEDARKLES